MKYVLGGHWTSVPEGWEVLTEHDQDITTVLKFGNSSVDCLFLCHVNEHVTLLENINFFREARRVLKPGGILRIVMPMIDQLVRYKDGSALSEEFTKIQLSNYYPEEFAALQRLGIDGNKYGQPFLFDSLLKKHNHKFLWSSPLLVKVLQAVGFKNYNINVCLPGQSFFDTSNCLERRIRGISAEDHPELEYFDPESLVVECKRE